MKIIDISPEHENTYFCCLEDWSDEMKEAGDNKQRWYERMKDKGVRVKLAMYRNGWCPAMNLVYERALRASKEFNGYINVTQYDTVDKEVLNEWGITDSLYIDGKAMRMGPPPSYDKIRKKIEKRTRRKKSNQLTQ